MFEKLEESSVHRVLFSGGKSVHKVISYTVIFQPMKGGGFNVAVPAIPEIITYGDILEEARDMAVDAIRCHLEGLEKDGIEAPGDKEVRLEATSN